MNPTEHELTVATAAIAEAVNDKLRGYQAERPAFEDLPRPEQHKALEAALPYARAALAALPDRAADLVPPGPCWDSAGITWPGGEVPRCELRAGHAGAHECTRPMGGHAVWTDAADPSGYIFELERVVKLLRAAWDASTSTSGADRPPVGVFDDLARAVVADRAR